MKNTKKILALVLCLAMCVSLFTGFAMAEGKDTVKLVCIGDSTSNGYGFADYGNPENGNYEQGCYWLISEASYPHVLKDYIEKQGNDVQLIPLTFQGMRTDELRAILDPSFVTDIANNKNGGKGDTFLNGEGEDHIGQYNRWIKNHFSKLGEDGYTKLTAADIADGNYSKAIFEEAIKTADVITLDTTMNNFGTYLTCRLQAILGEMNGYKLEEYSESVEELGDELNFDYKAVKTLIDDMLAKSGIELPELVSQLADMLLYCYCDFRVNFEANVGTILSMMKPDAKLIVVGAYNSMSGLKASLGDTAIDFGGIWASYMGLVNVFLTNTCKYADQYYYADCTGNMQTFINSMNLAKAAGGDMSLVDDSYQEKLADDIVGQFAKGVKAGAEFAEPALALIEAKNAVDSLVALGRPAADAFAMVSSQAPALTAAGITSYEILMYTYQTQVVPNMALIDQYKAAKAALDSGDLGEKVVDMYVKASDVVFDMGTLFGKMAEPGFDIPGLVQNAILGYVATGDWDSVDPVAKMLLHLNARFLTARGLGCHPDSVGVNEKGLRVIAAYEKTKVAKDEGAEAITDLGKNIFSAAWASFKAPVLDAVKGVFDNFANAIQEFMNFLLKPITDIIDLLPFC